MTDDPTTTAAVCRHCGDHTYPEDDPAPDLCAMCAKAGRTTTTAATWVVDCQRPGHPTNYAHAHPYISALCTDDDNHNACTVVGELTNVPGFCDCECHRAERVSARNEDRKPDY